MNWINSIIIALLVAIGFRLCLEVVKIGEERQQEEQELRDQARRTFQATVTETHDEITTQDKTYRAMLSANRGRERDEWDRKVNTLRVHRALRQLCDDQGEGD